MNFDEENLKEEAQTSGFEEVPCDDTPMDDTANATEETVNTVPPEGEIPNPEPVGGQPEEKDAKGECKGPSAWSKFMGRGDKKLEEKVQELTQKLTEMTNLRLMALAEQENMRKRLANERSQIRKNTIQDTLMPFLQVFEYFTMAMKSVEQKQNYDAIVQGMKMIFDQFGKAFDELDVERIDAVGKKFDPNLHEAVAREASDTVPEGIVLKQWNMGFKCGDRLLKAARVIVSSGPEKKAEEPAQDVAAEPAAEPAE